MVRHRVDAWVASIPLPWKRCPGVDGADHAGIIAAVAAVAVGMAAAVAANMEVDKALATARSVKKLGSAA